MRCVLLVGVLAVASGQIIAQEDTPDIIATEDDPNRDVVETEEEKNEMNTEETGDAFTTDGVSSSSEVESQGCKIRMCDEGEGDCDDNDECTGGNVCKMNSCKTKYTKKGRNWSEWADCCGPVGPFDWDYCKLKGPCDEGEGDCDKHSECAPGLKCGVNNCRMMHPDVPPEELNMKLDCCTRCSEVRVGVPGMLTKIGAEYFDAQKEVSGTERKLVNPPALFEPAAVWNLPALSDGEVIKLTCCKRRGSVCEFFISVYQCKPCSENLNGGLPSTLLNSGWDAGSCAPRFELPAGPAGVSHAMTSFHLTLTAGQSVVVPINKAAPHVAVFELPGPMTSPWCPRPVGPNPPGPPCVCIPSTTPE